MPSISIPLKIHVFFISNVFFNSASVLVNFSINSASLLRCCLIHISIIIVRHFLYLLYLCPWLDLGLFMSYLCDLFFSFSSSFSLWLIVRSHEYRHICSLVYFSEYVQLFSDEKYEQFSNIKSSASGCCLAFA